MGRPPFRTVADELLPCAISALSHLRSRGYRVRREVADHAAPLTPTLTAKRSSTTLHLDVVATIDIDRVKEWVAFGKSAGRDTRLALCVLPSHELTTRSIDELRALGVGLYSAGPGHFAEMIAPVDLAMNLELPSLAKLPRRAQELLGPAYDKFDKGEWREGFEEACNAFEEEARRYLKRWSRTGRIKVPSNTGPKQLSAAEIGRLPMGGLRDRYAAILSPNLLDSLIEHALREVNPDRVERVHRRRARRTEARLRANVGKHMWLLANVLKQMCE